FTKGTDSTTFTYGPDRSRYQKVQTRSSDNTTITTQYFGKVYEQIKQNTNTEHKHFIYLDKQLIAIHIKTDTTSTAGTSDTTNTPTTPIPDKTRYLHYDNLGSIDTITDGQGNIVERMSYAAFGERRKGDWRASDPLLPIIPTLTNRGFTGHEHIDEMGLIHMNGRVYDPQIGRFLSADPYIQAPYNTQSYNRYSYVVNNPLKYTDPTGNFFGIILGIISAVSTNAVIAAIGTKLFLAKIIIAYAVTYSVTYIATGSGKAAQGAGLSAALFMGIGELRGGKMGANGKMQYNPGWESGSMKTLAAHGLAGGIVQDRMGGSFGAGFLSGSLGSYLGSSGHSKNMFEMIGNTVRDAVVGGTISVIGGGKFANGAQTGAFRYLFNEWTHGPKQQYECMGRCHGNDYGDVRPMSAEEQELLFDATLILIPVPGASAYGSVKLLRFMAKHPKITKNLCVVTILCGLPPTSKIGQAASSIFEDIVITKQLQKRAIRKLIENQNMFRNRITRGK
ncbi:Rhs family protein-like precursor, partial [uncultured Gammaproteobacteria bacterium]